MVYYAKSSNLRELAVLKAAGHTVTLRCKAGRKFFVVDVRFE